MAQVLPPNKLTIMGYQGNQPWDVDYWKQLKQDYLQ
jgi:hypothetical protein